MNLLTRADWNVEITVERYADRSKYVLRQPFSVTRDGAPTIAEGMLTDYGGDRALSLLVGAGGTPLSNANTFLQVGSSTAAVSRSNGNLTTPLGARRTCSTGWPKLGVAGGLAVRQVQWRCVYDISDAVGSWQEFGLFDSLSGSTNMIDRFLSNQGSKPATQVWALLLTLTLA